MQIEILSVKVVTKPTKVPGKTYNSLEVAFKNLSFGGKVEGKAIMSFGATAEAYKVLALAAQGDVFDVDIIKNQAGYNDWVSAKKATGTVGAAQPASTSSMTSASTSGYTTSPKSTYETPEERAKKQVYIIRQSSLSNAIAALSVGAKAPPKVEDITKVAGIFEDFVFGTQSEVDSGLPEDMKDSEID